MSKCGNSADCHYDLGIVMAFSPPFVGCLVKKGLQKGGSRAPQDPTWLRPCVEPTEKTFKTGFANYEASFNNGT